MRVKILVITLFSSILLSAQEADTSYWRFGGGTNVTFSQVSLTNWAAGGENSVSLNGYFNTFAKYAKDKLTWSNNLEMGYGIIKQGKEVIKKTDDILIFSTQYGYKITNKLFWSNLIDFRTQFYEGVSEEEVRISNFMAPGYLVLATGLNWEGNENFSVNYAPVTGKFTFVNDEELAVDGAFGVEPGVRDTTTNEIIVKGKSSRAELGSFMKAEFLKENILPNVNVSSRLELFTSYLRNQGEVDINWRNQVIMKVNSHIAVNVQTQLLWDEDIKFNKVGFNGEVIGKENRVQFKSVFGVGMSYSFGQAPAQGGG